MKVFLVFGPSEARNGYVNVDPRQGSLDGTVEAGEASEVVAINILDYLAPAKQVELLHHWVSRLARGGSITVSCTDLYEVCRSLITGTLDEDAVTSVLYGTSKARRAAIFSEKTLMEKLRSLGLEIMTRRTDGLICTVTGRRPL